MISLQSHNQVLYHLMQLTSAFGSRTTPSVVKAKKPNETVCKKTEELCESSLMEAARNCQGLRVVKLNISNIATPKVKKNDVCVMLDNVSVNISRKLSNRNSKWTESYAVSMSVADGKQAFPDARDADVIVLPALRLSSQQQKRLLHSLCGKVNVQSHVETRGFKSKRLLKEEMEKDNSLVSLIKKQLRKFFNEKEKSKLSSFLNGQQGAEKLKTIFNNADLTQEERTRVKLAFVEGYEAGVERKTPQKSLLKIMYNLTIIAIVFSLIWYTIINAAGSMSGVFKLPIISQPEVDAEKISVTFDDVKGIDEAKLELKEVVEFLRNPAKFSSLGGKLPKGILLVGPPGTGKTLLARAVAGEAEVPFFYATGPEFDEILVGQGARRVRDLFRTAKERAPCVLFIDEIDSIGSKRTNSSIHPYANQTINQLLSEMDGFHHNDGVIVLGATNRRDDLDKALLRPGRFDVQIFIHIPDYDGRVDLFKLYLSKIMTKDMDLDELARVTMSFTGADIENMVNQAALRAAVEGAEYVTMEHMEYARDKVTLGPMKTKKTIEQRTLLVTAYHEGGHALVAAYTNHSMDLHKVTIISRGMSLGHTSYLGEKDPYLTTKAQFLARLDCLMGGRAAEELIFGKEFITTGAKSDLQYATEIAESMVTKFGMSEKAGLRVRERRKGLKEYGTDSSELVDAEVKRLLQESYERAKTILTTHAKEHKNLAEALLKYETLEAKEVMEIAQGRKIRDERFSDDSRIQTEDNRNPETIPI